MELISTAAAAKITGHTPQHLSSLCKEGKIPGAVRIGRAYAVPRSWAEDIAAFNARDSLNQYIEKRSEKYNGKS